MSDDSTQQSPGHPSSAQDSEPAADSGKPRSRGLRLRPPGVWFRALPFVMSAGLFMSGVFFLFAPLPLLLLAVSKGISWALLAGLVNAGIVYLISDSPELFQFFLIGIVLMAVVLPIFLKEGRLERALGWTWTLQVCVLAALITVYAALRGHQPWDEIRIVLGGFFDQMIEHLSPESRTQVLGDLTPEEWKAKSVVELPMSLLIVGILMIYVNMSMLVTLMGRALRGQMNLDRKSFYRWKNADWLIWPTILVWSGYLATLYFNYQGPLTDISLGLFKLILAIYGLQGIGIIGAYFDAWKVRGLFRLGLYFFALFVVLPLVVTIGFFDQWFDFRARIRQS